MARALKNVEKLQTAYNATYGKLLALGLSPDDQNYRWLSGHDCRLVTLDHSTEEPGEKDDELAWFWRRVLSSHSGR